MNETIMRFEEKAVFNLRSLYRAYGYLPYKMSKFEEYELYVRNKNFLVSDRVISFNDTNGKLMALKPDVTLSIIKNGSDIPGVKQKVCYNENVYRVSENTHRFEEIMQTGLECIGDIGLYDIYEVINLAAESLSTISDDFYLEVSNMDIVCAMITAASEDPFFIKNALQFISEKNPHDLVKLCAEYEVNEENTQKLLKLISLYGDRNKVLSELDGLCERAEIEKLRALSGLLDRSKLSEKIRFDFSVLSDMDYYNGFVFRGYISGICSGVLAGGQYDNMMKKMNRTSGAIGFALYLDRLTGFNEDGRVYAADCLLLYDDLTDPLEVSGTVGRLIASGTSVDAQKTKPPKRLYKDVIDLRKRK